MIFTMIFAALLIQSTVLGLPVPKKEILLDKAIAKTDKDSSIRTAWKLPPIESDEEDSEEDEEDDSSVYEYDDEDQLEFGHRDLNRGRETWLGRDSPEIKSIVEKEWKSPSHPFDTKKHETDSTKKHDIDAKKEGGKHDGTHAEKPIFKSVKGKKDKIPEAKKTEEGHEKHSFNFYPGFGYGPVGFYPGTESDKKHEVEPKEPYGDLYPILPVIAFDPRKRDIIWLPAFGSYPLLSYGTPAKEEVDHKAKKSTVASKQPLKAEKQKMGYGAKENAGDSTKTL